MAEESSDQKVTGDDQKAVFTSIKDSFFDDPFFKDWWNDFDLPMQSYNKSFNRQISETPDRGRCLITFST